MISAVRGLHCMTTYTNKLFVIGGNHFRGSTDYDDVLDCEYYQPVIDQWTRVSPMLTGQSDVGIAVYNDKIYVTGGYSWNNRCMVDIVQCYCPNSDKWETQFSLPEALGGIRACTLGKYYEITADATLGFNIRCARWIYLGLTVFHNIKKFYRNTNIHL